MSSSQLDEHIVKLSDHCKTHDMDVGRARRACRKNTFVGAKYIEWASRWVVDTSVPDVTTSLPDAVRGGFATTRTDGRQRYVIHALADEITGIASAFPDVAITDIRAVARKRRADKRVAAAAAAIVADVDAIADAIADADAIVNGDA